MSAVEWHNRCAGPARLLTEALSGVSGGGLRQFGGDIGA
jgi:hypothetical protein